MSFFISDAMAQAAPAAQEPNIMSQLIFFIGIFVIFYFLLIRPQQKRAKEHRNLVSALSKGDEVVTNGGLAGNIWWESENIRHLFPVGEVNGSHGVYR
ncbi:MAG: preprotein translocase subunit YajC, partial [Pseudomonadota bacterium]